MAAIGVAVIGAAVIGGGFLLHSLENIVSRINKKRGEEEPSSLQSKHFKKACSSEEVPPGWRLASIKDVRDHSEELQELISSSKLHCRLAYMSSYSVSECKDGKYMYNFESENLQKLDWQLLTNIKLPVAHDLSKELPSEFQIDPRLDIEEYGMSARELATLLLSEVRKWVPLRNYTTKILNEIGTNFKENEKVTAHVALKIALNVTGLLSILTGNAHVLQYCSVVATVLKIKTAKKLYECLKEYRCDFILHSAVSVISSDVQLSMRIQQLCTLFVNRCKEHKPENILATGALQYKKIFELIHGEPYKKQDPVESARALLDILQGNKENHPTGLALDMGGLVNVAHVWAVGSDPSDAASLLLKEVTKMQDGVSEITEKAETLNTPLEREEFREDLCVLFNRMINIPLSGDEPPTDKNREIAKLYMIVKFCTNLSQALSADSASEQDERMFMDLMCRFIPQVLDHQQRHRETKQIEVVLIAHAKVHEPMVKVEKYLPLPRDDVMVFFQPWGMKINGEGVAAIATGKLEQNPGGRKYFRPLENDQKQDMYPLNPPYTECNNAIYRRHYGQLDIPSITIDPFQLEDRYYREVVEYLKNNKESLLKDVEVFVWVVESQAPALDLCYITQVLQLYAYSLSNEKEPVNLTYKHAACLSDSPQLSPACQAHCDEQYAYCPKQGSDFDFMTFNL